MITLQQIDLEPPRDPDSAYFELRSPMPGAQELVRGARSREVAFLFGSFRLLPIQRLLLSGDTPVRLGSRALDILIILTERAGELVSKDDLMTRVWPNTFVVPANLTVHITALRRALREGVGGGRYFVNIPGRGYHFVAPVVLEYNVGSSALQAGLRSKS